MKTMKTKIYLSTGFMIFALIIIGTNAVKATKINVSGEGKITGNISSSKSNLPIENVSVTLFSATDSSMVVGTISDQFGKFYFSMLSSGKYFLEFSENGFEKHKTYPLRIQDDHAKINLGDVKLIPVQQAKKHKVKRTN